RRELLGARVGPRMLVAFEALDWDELVGEAALRVGGRPALLRAQRERVLILPRDAPALGDVFAGLAHRLQWEQLLHSRVREPPAAPRSGCPPPPGSRSRSRRPRSRPARRPSARRRLRSRAPRDRRAARRKARRRSVRPASEPPRGRRPGSPKQRTRRAPEPRR